MTTRRPTILIADDHTIVAEGLVKLLSRRFDVVATVADGTALVEAAERFRPDIIIADLEMPSSAGWRRWSGSRSAAWPASSSS